MNKDFIRQTFVGLKILLVMTVVLGIAYPAAVWGVGQVAFHDKANGQIVSQDGKDVGSAIIGQNFKVKDPEWFHGRPSAAEYDGLASAPSNLGPSNPDLLKAIKERQQEIARTEGVDVSEIPADAVTASASGLDPYISPEYAALQVDRVARERNLSASAVRALVRDNTSGRQLGFLGEPKVNVLRLNLTLERL
ncbi:potassium-transporting ATPase subunit KdpC [Aeromicrobium sp. 9AM]|uniref:potassium-transporting ATPase subunit KdpC n=1 Tax=Aeromicrobium sp. 9AM TaxID=2653126 RepID=UPI0012F2BD31|nr:potassium-transporting ATPase subunit KdpC [Aeromicrobium sp. 9AM]VXC22091.1 Potassium-transporting ATPase KdpC subunit [Aeromicrobium sp. 9AM]